VYAPGSLRPGRFNQWVETTQVAPTVLELLGLDPGKLQAVQEEGTRVLSGVSDGDGRNSSHGHSSWNSWNSRNGWHL
jgi:hypothetical protein